MRDMVGEDGCHGVWLAQHVNQQRAQNESIRDIPEQVSAASPKTFMEQKSENAQIEMPSVVRYVGGALIAHLPTAGGNLHRMIGQ